MWNRTIIRGAAVLLFVVAGFGQVRNDVLMTELPPSSGQDSRHFYKGTAAVISAEAKKQDFRGRPRHLSQEKVKREMDLMYLTDSILSVIMAQSQKGLAMCHPITDYINVTAFSADFVVGLETNIHTFMVDILLNHLTHIMAYIQAAINTGHWVTQQIYEEVEVLVEALEHYGVDVMNLGEEFMNEVMELAKQISEKLWGFTTGNSVECIPSKPHMMTGLDKDALRRNLVNFVHALVSEHINKYCEEHHTVVPINLTANHLHTWEQNIVDCALRPTNESLILLNSVTEQYINNEVNAMNFMLQEMFDIMTIAIRVIPVHMLSNVTAIMDSIPKDDLTGKLELQTCQHPLYPDTELYAGLSNIKFPIV